MQSFMGIPIKFSEQQLPAGNPIVHKVVIEVPMKKTADGNYVADVSGLSDDDKRLLIESLKQQAHLDTEIEGE